jgi:hypothetical protein
MRTLIPAELRDHFQGDVICPATCWEFHCTNGQKRYFTDHDQSLLMTSPLSAFTQTYSASLGGTRSAFEFKISMAVGNTTITGFLDENQVDEHALRGGMYDNAKIYMFITSWDNTARGVVRGLRGWIGEVKQKGMNYEAEGRGLMHALNTNIGSLTAPHCRSEFGGQGSGPSSGCRMPIDIGGIHPTSDTYYGPPGYMPWTPNKTMTIEAAGINLETIQTISRGWPVHVVPSLLSGFTGEWEPEENGFQYRVSVAGQAGATPPTWPTTIGGTVSDGTGQWAAIPKLKRLATIVSVTNRRLFVVGAYSGYEDAFGPEASRAFAAGGDPEGGVWSGGTIYISNSGLAANHNSGLTREIKSDTIVGDGLHEIELSTPFPFDVVPYDAGAFVFPQIYLTIGCNKTKPVCKDIMHNLKNMRAEIFLPGNDKMFAFPESQGDTGLF